MDYTNDKYLKRLAIEYPNKEAVIQKIAKNEATLRLPKGTEHFMSDIHGEHEAFFHIMKNASGALKRKIDDALKDKLSKEDVKELATIIYYPKEKIEEINRHGALSDEEYEEIIKNMLLVAKECIHKYSQEKIRNFIEDGYEETLLNLLLCGDKKEEYQNQLIKTMIANLNANRLIEVISSFIQKSVVEKLHIIGDIYDRGPGPHFIMDYLENHHAFDVQWGNHDVLWMGAALGHSACICNIIRNSLRYDSLDIISDGYGINMIPLMQFATKYYENDPCTCYAIKGREITNDYETQLTLKMHKAISVIQWKIEGQIVIKNPEYNMDDRRILENIDYENGTLFLDGRTLPLKDSNYPTVDPLAPYELNEDEKALIERLSSSFKECEKLNRHARLLVKNGGMYKKSNGNLLFHACVLLNEDGSLMEASLDGKKFKGKAWFDYLEQLVRKAFTSDDVCDIEKGKNILWYLWNAPASPVFGKHKMATFERYILDDEEAKKENKNPYYRLIKDEEKSEEVVKMILEEFGLDKDTGVIVNGHVPVKQNKGESPVKANGRLFVIDGGFSKSYHKETGIAGYTLISNSYMKYLVAHSPFSSTKEAVTTGYDIISDNVYSVKEKERILISQTDCGEKIREEIKDLERLLYCYRNGIIRERR